MIPNYSRRFSSNFHIPAFSDIISLTMSIKRNYICQYTSVAEMCKLQFPRIMDAVLERKYMSANGLEGVRGVASFIFNKTDAAISPNRLCLLDFSLSLIIKTF